MAASYQNITDSMVASLISDCSADVSGDFAEPALEELWKQRVQTNLVTGLWFCIIGAQSRADDHNTSVHTAHAIKKVNLTADTCRLTTLHS